MVLTPGDADSALTIGSVDYLGSPASNSGYGPNAAGQVKPDVCGMGVSASAFSSNSYTNLDGTSLSTPQIAGWAACLWQANPAATPYQLRQAIRRCASSYSAPTAHIGYGVPNFQCTEQILNVKDTPPSFTPSRWVIASPNPFNNELKLAVSPEENGYVDLTMADMAGRKVMDIRQYFIRGYNAPFTISLPELPAGIYVLKAGSANRQEVIKLEKY